MSEYFIKRGEKTHGPFSERQIRHGIDSGKISSSDLSSVNKKGPWKSLELVLNTVSQDINAGPESFFDDINLADQTEPITAFVATPQSSVQNIKTAVEIEPSKSFGKTNKRSPADLLEVAQRELDEKEKESEIKTSILPKNLRYPTHFLWAFILAFMLALLIPLFCFIPMGFLYKYFNDRDEELIAYFYLGGGVVSAIGSIVFLGMAWQGSLKLGEQAYNRTAKNKSELYQDGWTHPLIWLFSSNEEALTPEHEKTKKSMEKIHQGILRMRMTSPPASLERIVKHHSNENKGLEWETKDGWQKQMRYVRDSTKGSFTIFSAGPDGEFETSDDLNYRRVYHPQTGSFIKDRTYGY